MKKIELIISDGSVYVFCNGQPIAEYYDECGVPFELFDYLEKEIAKYPPIEE